MQDSVVWAVEQGWSLGDLCEMTLVAFDSLVESLERLDTARRAEQLQMQHMAAQGEAKAVQKWLNNIIAPMVGKGSADDFDARFGNGI